MFSSLIFSLLFLNPSFLQCFMDLLTCAFIPVSWWSWEGGKGNVEGGNPLFHGNAEGGGGYAPFLELSFLQLCMYFCTCVFIRCFRGVLRPFPFLSPLLSTPIHRGITCCKTSNVHPSPSFLPLLFDTSSDHSVSGARSLLLYPFLLVTSFVRAIC